MVDIRVGTGYDVHAFAEGRPLVLGGVTIPHERGLQGHSDADVLSHAIGDAMLGAAGLGDIGVHFPDDDARYQGISSLVLLQRIIDALGESGYTVTNVDATVVAERPKLAPYVQQMRSRIGESLRLPDGRVSIKATTSERLGFTGREEGIAAHAVVLIRSADDG